MDNLADNKAKTINVVFSLDEIDSIQAALQIARCHWQNKANREPPGSKTECVAQNNADHFDALFNKVIKIKKEL